MRLLSFVGPSGGLGGAGMKGLFRSAPPRWWQGSLLACPRHGRSTQCWKGVIVFSLFSLIYFLAYVQLNRSGLPLPQFSPLSILVEHTLDQAFGPSACSILTHGSFCRNDYGPTSTLPMMKTTAVRPGKLRRKEPDASAASANERERERGKYTFPATQG